MRWSAVIDTGNKTVRPCYVIQFGVLSPAVLLVHLRKLHRDLNLMDELTFSAFAVHVDILANAVGRVRSVTRHPGFGQWFVLIDALREERWYVGIHTDRTDQHAVLHCFWSDELRLIRFA